MKGIDKILGVQVAQATAIATMMLARHLADDHGFDFAEACEKLGTTADELFAIADEWEKLAR